MICGKGPKILEYQSHPSVFWKNANGMNAENCMEMKEFGPGGSPWRPLWIRQWHDYMIILKVSDLLAISD